MYSQFIFTGVISTLKNLDHETTKKHELIIKVNDNGVKEFSDYAKVIINVEVGYVAYSE